MWRQHWQLSVTQSSSLLSAFLKRQKKLIGKKILVLISSSCWHMLTKMRNKEERSLERIFCLFSLLISITSVSVYTADQYQQMNNDHWIEDTNYNIFILKFFFTTSYVEIIRIFFKFFFKVLVRNGYFLFFDTKINFSPRYVRHILPCRDVCCRLMAKYLISPT